MTIEEELFKKTKVDFNKLAQYGFIEKSGLYQYSKEIMDHSFRIDIEIDSEGIVKGKVYDLSFGDEYTNFRIEHSVGSFVGEVREEFINLLKDIREKCFKNKFFIYDQSNRISDAIWKKYGDGPSFEWEKYPGYATFKNKDNKKWYGIILNLDKRKLENNASGEVEILDIKLDPNEIEELLEEDGFYPAYHMNKKNWITLTLNDTLSDEAILKLIDKSHSFTINQKSSVKNEWIVPANPKYFDLEKALKESNNLLWKQSTGIKERDIVYLYVGEPYSSIMYQFRVLEVNIPYEYKDEHLQMQKVMKMELITKYERDQFSFSKLKNFGLQAIRGPRYMPLELSKYIHEKNN